MRVEHGSTNVSTYFQEKNNQDGLTWEDIDQAYYTRDQAVAVPITPKTQTVTGAHDDGGFVEVDATNAKGLYRFDPPDACWATASRICAIHLQGEGLEFIPLKVDLDNLSASIAGGQSDDHFATGQTDTAGDIDAGSYTSTLIEDGSYFQISPTGAVALEQELLFNIGADRKPNTIKVVGYYEGQNPGAAAKYAQVEAYNYSTSSFDLISSPSNRMNHATADEIYEFSFLQDHVDVTGTPGNMRVRFVSGDIAANSDLYLDLVSVASVPVSGITVDDIANAVWQHIVTNHTDHDTAGYRVSQTIMTHHGIAVKNTATTFTIEDVVTPATDLLNGYKIRVHNETTDEFAEGVVIDSATADANELVLTLAEALPFIPDVGTHSVCVMQRVVAVHDILSAAIAAYTSDGTVGFAFGAVLGNISINKSTKVVTATINGQAKTGKLVDTAGVYSIIWD